MAIEKDIPIDQAAFALPAPVVNRFTMSSSSAAIARLSFGETANGVTHWRSCVAMTYADAHELAELILTSLPKPALNS